MKKKYITVFVFFIIHILSIKISATEVDQIFLQLVHGGRNISVITSGDIDNDKKSEILLSTQFFATIIAYKDNIKNFYIHEPFSYVKGEISVLAITDLNGNGINEIIYGYREVADYGKGPSVSIIEKIGNEYKVTWESKYLGMVGQFFIHDKNIVIFTDSDYGEPQEIHLLRYVDGKYVIADSIGINGIPVYVGQIGTIKNGIVLGSSINERIGTLEKYGSHVNGISLINYKIIDFGAGRFKEANANFHLPQKDVWDCNSFDLDGDGEQELIIGVVNDKNIDVESYKFTSGKYEKVSKFHTASALGDSLGLILTDMNGDKKKEILSFDGTWIRYENGNYRSSNILAKISTQFYFGPVNMTATDLDQDGKDELVILVANLKTYIVNDQNTGDYEAYLLDFNDLK